MGTWGSTSFTEWNPWHSLRTHTKATHERIPQKKKKTLSLLPRNTHAVFDTPTVSFQNYANPQAQQHDFVGGFVCLFVFLSLALTNAVLSKPDTHWQTVSLTPCWHVRVWHRESAVACAMRHNNAPSSSPPFLLATWTSSVASCTCRLLLCSPLAVYCAHHILQGEWGGGG